LTSRNSNIETAQLLWNGGEETPWWRRRVLLDKVLSGLREFILGIFCLPCHARPTANAWNIEITW
jgi:hypothetical protein